MINDIVGLAHDVMSSPWIYLALFAISAIDAFFPVVPSESLVITAGVFAASGEPKVMLVVLAAATGAFLGDHISYSIGRTAGVGLRRKFANGPKGQASFAWAERVLRKRGGLILVVVRYIPGGRTACTITAGTVRYPLRKFSFFIAIAGITWGFYAAFIGYFGGRAFEEDPVKGLLVGFGVALAVVAVVEVTRYFVNRRRAKLDQAQTPHSDKDSSLPANDL